MFCYVARYTLFQVGIETKTWRIGPETNGFDLRLGIPISVNTGTLSPWEATPTKRPPLIVANILVFH